MSQAPQTTGQQPAGRPGRYQRSTNGLVGSLVVTLLAIGAFVAFRALNRDQVEIGPEHVDYLSAVEGAQQGGVDVVYPRSLPSGWFADSVHLTPGRNLAWGIGILTDDDRFAGVRQAGRPLGSLVRTYVDEEATAGDPVSIDSEVADRWKTFSDSGGDHAYGARVDGTSVLVYGSAPTSDLQRIVESLTTEQR